MTSLSQQVFKDWSNNLSGMCFPMGTQDLALPLQSTARRKELAMTVQGRTTVPKRSLERQLPQPQQSFTCPWLPECCSLLILYPRSELCYTPLLPYSLSRIQTQGLYPRNFVGTFVSWTFVRCYEVAFPYKTHKSSSGIETEANKQLNSYCSDYSMYGGEDVISPLV